MKKILYFLVSVLEIGLLAGAYAVDYFTTKKLGMNRWVNFTCLRWEEIYPISLIKMVVIALILILTVFIVLLYMKKKKMLKKIVGAMVAVMIIMSVISICYILFVSMQTMRAYYLISIILTVATGLQLMKTLVGIIVCKK